MQFKIAPAVSLCAALSTAPAYAADLVSAIFDYQDHCRQVGGRHSQQLIDQFMLGVYQLDNPTVQIYSDGSYRGALNDMAFVEQVVAYQAFRRHMDINGVDGRGGLERNVANVGDDFNCRTNNEDNAWAHEWIVQTPSGRAQFPYNAFYPVGMKDPVSIGHEAYHTYIGANSGLEYEFQSGALNEALADAFGVSFQIWLNAGTPNDLSTLNPSRSDWQLGATYVMRDLAAPNDADQPDHMSQFESLSSSQDHGGVHINSGIINHAFYLLSEGGQHRRRQTGPIVNGIGVFKALTIWHNGGDLMGPYTKFIEARDKFQISAAEIYGYNSPELAATVAALDAVGIPSVPLPQPPTGVPTEPEPQVEIEPEIPAEAESETVVEPEPVIEVVSTSPTSTPTALPSSSTLPVEASEGETGSAFEPRKILIFVLILAGLGLIFLARRKPFEEYDQSESTPVLASTGYSAKLKKPPKQCDDGSIKLHINGKKLMLKLSDLSTRYGVVFGRSSEFSNVSLPNSKISRQHFRLGLDDQGQLYALDLHSSAGTLVNGSAIPPMQKVALIDGVINVPGYEIKVMG